MRQPLGGRRGGRSDISAETPWVLHARTRYRSLFGAENCQPMGPYNRSDHYHRVMVHARVVHSRTGPQNRAPSGRQGRTRSGNGPFIPAETGRGSMRAGQRQHLSAFTLGQSAPYSVRFMHLQGVRATGGQGRAFETHGLCLRLSAGSCRSPFAFRMEEERTGHSPACRMQLPVPKISIRAGKAPRVGHVDPLCSDQCESTICEIQVSKVPTAPGIWARSTSRSDHSIAPRTGVRRTRALTFRSRIRADPDAVDLQTLERFSARDKSLITKIVDLDLSFPGESEQFPRPHCATPPCGVAHTTTRDQE